MKLNIELCRDDLQKRFPNRTIFVEVAARVNRHKSGDTVSTEYKIFLVPGFDYEEVQRFTGQSLGECMEKLEKLTPDANRICDAQDVKLIDGASMAAANDILEDESPEPKEETK